MSHHILVKNNRLKQFSHIYENKLQMTSNKNSNHPLVLMPVTYKFMSQTECSVFNEHCVSEICIGERSQQNPSSSAENCYCNQETITWCITVCMYAPDPHCNSWYKTQVKLLQLRKRDWWLTHNLVEYSNNKSKVSRDKFTYHFFYVYCF